LVSASTSLLFFAYSFASVLASVLLFGESVTGFSYFLFDDDDDDFCSLEFFTFYSTLCELFFGFTLFFSIFFSSTTP